MTRSSKLHLVFSKDTVTLWARGSVGNLDWTGLFFKGVIFGGGRGCIIFSSL